MTDLARFDWNRLTANWEAWWRGELRRPMVHVRIEAPPGAVDAYPLHYMSMYDFSVPAEEILAVQEEYLKRCTYLADSYPSCWLNFGPGVLAAMIGGEGHNGENTVWFTPGRWENCDAAGIRPAFDPASPWVPPHRRALPRRRPALERKDPPRLHRPRRRTGRHQFPAARRAAALRPLRFAGRNQAADPGDSHGLVRSLPPHQRPAAGQPRLQRVGRACFPESRSTCSSAISAI